MSANKRKWYAPAGAFAILLVCLGLFFVWATTGSHSILAQNPQRTDNTQAMPQREDSNLTLLTSLLSTSGVSVRRAELLPAHVENSNTIHVKFESTDTRLQGSGLQTTMLPEFSLSRLEVKPNTGGVARQRSLELSPTLVLVVAVDQHKQMLWWNLLPDPRVVRAEIADTNGKLSGQTMFRSSAEMLIAYPAHKSISELRFYHPNWNGQEYNLDVIGNLTVPRVE